MTFDFIPYMRTLAETLKDLLHTGTDTHFTRVTSVAGLEEFLQESSTLKGYQMVVLDKDSGRLDDSSQSDNLLDRGVFTWWIFAVASGDDFDAIETTKAGIKTVAKKVMAKMFKDKRDMANGLANLDRNIYYDSIGPVAQGWYGTMVTFNVKDAAGIVYDPNDWN